MPLIKIHPSNTSLPAIEERPLLEDLSARLAAATGKPEQYVMTCLMPRASMTFGGTHEPACYVEVKSLGGFTPEQTEALSAELCEVLGEALRVPADRIYIEFAGGERHLWGWNESTFA